MKKTFKFFLFVVLILSAFCFVSCKQQIPKEPTDVQADFWKLTWNGHPDTTEYVIEIFDKEYRTTETEFLMFDYISPGKTAHIRVKALFGSDADTSEWVEITYTAEDATEGLVYELNGNDVFDYSSGYTVFLPADKIPENGELVIPDTYEGEYVVGFRSETKPNPLDAGITGSSSHKESSEYNGVSYSKITKVRFPKELSEIQTGALYNASVSEIYLPSTVIAIHASAFESCDKLEKIYFSDSITSIGDFAFGDCTALADVTLPKKLTDLGVGAFKSTAITKVDIPETLQYIYENVFKNCTSLSQITFSDALEEIRPGAFHNTAWYNSQPDGMLILHNRIYCYKGEMPENTSLVIPSTVTHFAGRNTFKDQKNLVSITIPGSIKVIPFACFEGCINLREVKLSEGLETIGYQAFKDCGIEQVTLPSSMIEGLPSQAFMNCTNLKSVKISDNKKIKFIGSRFVYNCENLTEINIPEGVEKIHDEAFTYCTALTSLKIPDSVTYFTMNSICHTSITHFVWPKNVEYNHFYTPKYKNGCPLNYLVIQKGTKLLQYSQFHLYDNLDTFYFEGTEEEFKEIEIERIKASEKWESNLRVYYYSETKPLGVGYYWHYVDGLPVKW